MPPARRSRIADAFAVVGMGKIAGREFTYPPTSI
jgi:glutamine synthetase adenylyltransferase